MTELTQVGEFHISDVFLHNHLDEVQKIMGEVVVVSCVHNYGYGRFEYIAFSSHFRAIPRDGSAAPLYAVTSITNAGEITYKEIEL